MISRFRYSHGGKTFNVNATEIETQDEVTVEVFIMLAAITDDGLLPVNYRYLDERIGRKIHMKPAEFFQRFHLSEAIKDEIARQRQSM